MSKHEDDNEVGLRFTDDDGESFIARPENTTLFTFAGDLAIHDHVFISHERDEETRREIGTYIFLVSMGEETAEDVKDYLLDNEYPAHINLREVAECDRDAYQHMVDNRVAAETDELGDFLPDGWQ